MSQAVVNVVNNAQQALHTNDDSTVPMAGGTVKLSTRRVNDQLQIRIRDDGPGIAREHHERIFEPYVQIGAGASVERKGHGLGLAGARKLARRLGGEIAVSSETGAGSVFRLTVPLRRTPDPQN